MFCSGSSIAKKRYERDMLRMMVAYMVVLFGAAWIIRHDHPHRFALYFFSVLPAIPVIGVIARMGKYLKDESDEYLRLLAMQSILVGTAALLGTLVVNDFVRAFAGESALPPFISFLVFCAGMGITQLVQKLRDRVPGDD